jgi:hypothetical protein
MKRLVLLLAILSITLFAGCRTVAVIPLGHHSTVTQTQHIYPPHNPGHGHRHNYYGHDLEYDTDFGAYMVLGYDGIYFYNDAYLRFNAGSWQVTSSLNGAWHDAEYRHIPNKLRNHRRYNRHQSHSPPSHAPANGHRYRHDHGVDLVFDSGIGAYIVLGFDNLFFFNNNYMRFDDGYWHYSDRHNGGWLRSKDKHVPRKLREARKHNKKSFFKKLKKQYRKEHQKSHQYRERHKNNKKNGRRDNRGKDRRDGDKNKKGKRRKKDYDDDDTHDNDRREKRDSGWLR